jgi:transglutaminase-like putative cysteine protease
MLSIRHTTRYRYTEPLLYSVQTLHLWPSSGPCQRVVDWSIQVPGRLNELPATQGNREHSFSLSARAPDGLMEVVVVAQGKVEPTGVAEYDDTTGMPPAFYRRSSALAEPHPRLTGWARERLGARATASPTASAALALAAAVAERVRYRPGNTGVETTALEAFDWGLGVCQDQAHVMVALCRGLGWPARYVSGYFFAQNEPELASHAWVDVCLDDARSRWLSVDVTHACATDHRHVRLAAATDYAACLPIKGMRRGGGQETLDVRVQIDPIGSS